MGPFYCIDRAGPRFAETRPPMQTALFLRSVISGGLRLDWDGVEYLKLTSGFLVYFFGGFCGFCF